MGKGSEYMLGNPRWKVVIRIVILTVVAYGIFASIRNSTDELAKVHGQLEEQAAALEQEASLSQDPDQIQRLQDEAERLRGSLKRFWLVSPKYLLLSGLFYVGGMLPASLFWRRCLVELNQVHDLFDTLWAYFYGNLGKYFPGKAMVIVLRLAALQHHGIKKTTTTMTIFMETLTMMSVGGAVASLALIFLNIDWRLTLLSVALLIVTFVPSSPPVLRFLLPKLQRGVDADTVSEWTGKLRWTLLMRGWGMLTVGWILNGFSLLFVLQGLTASIQPQAAWHVLYLSALGACALAVVLGFVSLVPGGAGVREVVLSAVLTPVVGPVAALSSALWLRIVWLIAELTVVGLLAYLKFLGFGTAMDDDRSVQRG